MRFSVQSISMSTRLRGFTSVVGAHEHLFKHVIPLGRHFPAYRHERWEELKQGFLHAKEADGRRRFLRAPLSIPVTFTSEEELIQAHTREVGAGGLGLKIAANLAIDDQVTLELILPGDTTTTSVHCRVAWVAGQDRIGFEFLDLPAAARDRIDALVWEDVDVSDL